MGSAVGIGPIDTMDKALRNAIEDVYPDIKKISLTDYKVRVLTPEKHTSSSVRVLITTSSESHDWSTIGVHENIVDASWIALIDSYEYFSNVIMKLEAEK